MRGPRSTLVPVGCALVAAALMLAHSDEIRTRAEAALGAGMPAREAALARGFVLGQDAAIDERTREDFRRSGLSHLLAVSGQNVALLALLAMPLLAAAGLPLRARLLWALALIAAYVPLAGSGPSIQRAAVMGALGLLATFAGRRGSSFYALAVAAVVTLAIDPGIGRDPGWQLSFAAVLGILLLVNPLRRALRRALEGPLRGPSPSAQRSGGASRPGRGAGVGAHLAGAMVDGAAMTIAATLATAPLIAYWFDSFSTTTLVANLLALPAVAPAMWLGMLAAGAGQIPGFPVALLNDLNAPLLAYVAQVAAWLGRPGWAHVEISLDGRGLLASYVALSLARIAAPHLARALPPAIRRPPPPGMSHFPSTGGGKCDIRSRWGELLFGRRKGWALFAILAMAGVAALAWAGGGGGGARGAPAAEVLRVSVLDIGQGDAILLQPGRAAPILVDLGPPGVGLVGLLRAAGVEALGAAIVTHDQSDHAGGLEELLAAFPVGRVLHGRLGAKTRALTRAVGGGPTGDAAGLPRAVAGPAAGRLWAGRAVRSGRLRLQVLWPPPELLGARGADPNRLSLVLLARWPGFRMLLTGDAEAESVPLDPGPLDALKLAHHGSEDAGLPDLLARTNPRLALISAGADNPHGHPSPQTLQGLTTHGVPFLLTSEDGTIVLEVPLRPYTRRHARRPRPAVPDRRHRRRQDRRHPRPPARPRRARGRPRSARDLRIERGSRRARP